MIDVRDHLPVRACFGVAALGLHSAAAGKLQSCRGTIILIILVLILLGGIGGSPFYGTGYYGGGGLGPRNRNSVDPGAHGPNLRFREAAKSSSWKPGNRRLAVTP